MRHYAQGDLHHKDQKNDLVESLEQRAIACHHARKGLEPEYQSVDENQRDQRLLNRRGGQLLTQLTAPSCTRVRHSFG